MDRKVRATPEELFSEWWYGAARKISKAALLSSVDPEDAHYLVYGIAERVFLSGYRGVMWSLNPSDSLSCELDRVIEDAYLAGKEAVS